MFEWRTYSFMDAPSRRHGPTVAGPDPADAFSDVARILARAAVRQARSQPRIELEVSRDLRLSVSPTAASDATGKETSR